MNSSERRRTREHAIFELLRSVPVTKRSDGVENDEPNEEDKEELSRRKAIASGDPKFLLTCYEIVLHA